MWDYDGVGDDLIGTTDIDIEDRWFSKSWRLIDKKPLERRTLHCPTSSTPQGKLELFCELITMEKARDLKMWNINPIQSIEYELRLIIWNIDQIPAHDNEGQNDLLVVAHCTSNQDKQKTDIHWRSKHGKGSFNWRMKFPIQIPCAIYPRLRLQIWDVDVFSANDAICETTLSLKKLCKYALLPENKHKRIQMVYNKKNRFWLDNLTKPADNSIKEGKIEISLELIPKTLIDKYPAGLCRDQPNQNPFLPPPSGRINLSFLHPLDACYEIIGPDYLKKLACFICLSLIVSGASYLVPMIIANLITP